MPMSFTKTLDALVPRAPESVSGLAPQFVERHPKAFAAAVVAAIALAYLLTINGFWHMTADSGFYLTLAQNVHAGNGYIFNGVPHAKYPGGLPYLLAAAMAVSRSFLWLNVVQCAVMLLALCALYFLLRQMADRATSLLALLLTALLFWAHEFSMALMSEAPFFLCSNASVLLLLLLIRSAPGRRRALLLAGVCAACALAAWCRVAAAFWVVPFAAALLLTGRGRHRLANRAANAAVVCVVIVAAFFVYEWWGDRPRPHPPRPAPRGYGLRLAPERALSAAWRLPRWPLSALCPPGLVLADRLLPPAAAEAPAWALVGVLLIGSWQALRKGQVLLATSPTWLLPLAVWGAGGKATMGRYGLGIAPFLVLLLLMGLEAIGRWAQRRVSHRLKPGTLVGLGIAFVLLPNLALLGGEVVVQRRADFYAAYRGGAYEHLMGIAKWMQERNLNELVALQDSCGWGVVLCLTDCTYVQIPQRVRPNSPEGLAEMAEFARTNGVRYIVTRSFELPWPTWHLRPRHVAGGGPAVPYFRLWEYDAAADSVREIKVAPCAAWPTSLPGKRPIR
jgi:hypothetical protein